ncbi:hypothetical protein F383_28818 [Gossypium arboreum]|uniref:Uncharacterized protein n=1 Tax=Gossypium arboreum TaxID=29729 RepID=A0A0B0MR85_GOSAR|nr:hypothetical protein F383_28818 [Gossypium arboreum]
MQLSKPYAYSLFFPFSYSVTFLARGSTDVGGIDHTINQSTWYS